MSRNKITQIEKETFQGLNNLTTIILSENQITHIEKETFRGLNSLKEIQLHRNNFKRSFLKLSLEPSVKFLSWTNNAYDSKNEIQTVRQVILSLFI